MLNININHKNNKFKVLLGKNRSLTKLNNFLECSLSNTATYTTTTPLNQLYFMHIVKTAHIRSYLLLKKILDKFVYENSSTFYFYFHLYIYLLDLQKNVGAIYIGQAIFTTCFRRCQDAAAWFIFFALVFSFIKV